MNREELQKLIQTAIQDVAFEHLKELNTQKKVQSTNDYLNSKNIGEEELDHALFHGGRAPDNEEKVKGRITIKENAEPGLKITVGEIKEFENSFKEILDNIPGASIVFDKQKNGYSIAATKRPDGVEAKASGILNLGDNGKVIWSYSILNGFNLNAQNLKLSQSNKTMFESLFNHYDDWQKSWREKLNLPNAADTKEPEGQAGNTPLPGADMAQSDQNAASALDLGAGAPPVAPAF
jgi:hypothetical protein